MVQASSNGTKYYTWQTRLPLLACGRVKPSMLYQAPNACIDKEGETSLSLLCPCMTKVFFIPITVLSAQTLGCWTQISFLHCWFGFKLVSFWIKCDLQWARATEGAESVRQARMKRTDEQTGQYRLAATFLNILAMSDSVSEIIRAVTTILQNSIPAEIKFDSRTK